MPTYTQDDLAQSATTGQYSVADLAADQPSTGDQFKQQAWSQAGQNLRQGHILDAAKNIGSLFRSQNPAAVSAVSDTAGALRSVLPQGAPRPQPPVATAQEFQKLPKEQQDAYAQQFAKWQADQYGTSMQLAAGFMTPGSAGNAASDVASSVKNALPSAMKERAGELFQSVAQDAGKVKVNLGTATQESADKLLGWQKMINQGSIVNKFLQRVTKPNAAPLTYSEARQWYQVLGNLSADEAGKLPPSVKRDLAGLVTNLKTDIGNAAGEVGRAADYYRAMGDFAKASRLQDAWATYKPWLIKTGIYATGAGVGVKAGYSLYKLLTGE